MESRALGLTCPSPAHVHARTSPEGLWSVANAACAGGDCRSGRSSRRPGCRWGGIRRIRPPPGASGEAVLSLARRPPERASVRWPAPPRRARISPSPRRARPDVTVTGSAMTMPSPGPLAGWASDKPAIHHPQQTASVRGST